MPKLNAKPAASAAHPIPTTSPLWPQATPPCAHGYLKSATISFGQNLREDDLHCASLAAQNADLAIAPGSTLSVYPAAMFPLLAAEHGAPYIIINQGQTDHDGHPTVTLRLEGNVTEIFPRAVALALEKSHDS